MAGATYRRRPDGVYQIIQSTPARAQLIELGHLLLALTVVALTAAAFAFYPVVSLLLTGSAGLYAVTFFFWQRAHRPPPPIAFRAPAHPHRPGNGVVRLPRA